MRSCRFEHLGTRTPIERTKASTPMGYDRDHMRMARVHEVGGAVSIEALARLRVAP